ncbi:MAG TPA: hypothetical protein VGL82_15860 [Bryobacteraceae bacterium]|jgi:hypothetical protein
MLWYRSWLETRWRFLISLGVLVCSVGGIVFLWPKVVELIPAASNLPESGSLGGKIREAVELSRNYPSYIWSQWYAKNLISLGTLFAVLLGAGGVLSKRSGGMFMLSLPVSRRHLLGTRAVTGLAELTVLALAPSVLIPLLSPAVGKTYGIEDALVYGGCFFIAASLFFSMALLLSTIFEDVWRPLLISLAVCALMVLAEQPGLSRWHYGIVRVMSGEDWFRNRQLPWPGLLASAGASVAFFYGAVINLGRRDF